MLFHDFEHEIRTNPIYFDKVMHAIENIKKTYEYTLKHNSGYELHREAIMDYLRITNFNVSPLLGFYFPQYPGTKPYSLKDFPFAHCYYTLNIGPGAFSVFRASRQVGKSLHSSTLVKLRNKHSGEIKEIPIGELYELIGHKAHSNNTN